jgi:hypothetical protein
MAEEIVKFYGVKEAIGLMRTFEPEIYKQLRKDIRGIVAPAVSSIKSTAPNVAPLSGMIHNGRTAWTKPKVTVNITPAQRSRAFGSTTSNLVAISATGQGRKVGFDIADMAGRANQPNKYPKTRRFVDPRTGEVVQRRVNGQGRGMIANLPAKASRYVYPAIEKQLPFIRSQVAITIEKAADSINRKLKRV